MTLSAGRLTCSLFRWLVLLIAWRQGSYRSCPKSECSKREDVELSIPFKTRSDIGTASFLLHSLS